MLKPLWIFAGLALSGCQAMLPNQGYDPQLTAAQIKAIASDKNADVVCSNVPTPMGPAKVVVINLDQRVIENGGITTSPDCQITITTTKPEPKPKETPK